MERTLCSVSFLHAPLYPAGSVNCGNPGRRRKQNRNNRPRCACPAAALPFLNLLPELFSLSHSRSAWLSTFSSLPSPILASFLFSLPPSSNLFPLFFLFPTTYLATFHPFNLPPLWCSRLHTKQPSHPPAILTFSSLSLFILIVHISSLTLLASIPLPVPFIGTALLPLYTLALHNLPQPRRPSILRDSNRAPTTASSRQQHDTLAESIDNNRHSSSGSRLIQHL